jgi:hypothetical protein
MWHIWVTGEVHIRFWWGEGRERDHLKDVGLDGKIILKWIFKKWEGGMDWINLAQDRDTRRTFLHAITNLRVA